MKPEETFRNSLSPICEDCEVLARESFYQRVKNHETYTKKPYQNSRNRLKAPIRPENSIHKRCPSCNSHVWVLETEAFMDCWKCEAKLKIAKALRDSTCHRGGVILSVVE